MPTQQVVVGGSSNAPSTTNTRYTGLMGNDYLWGPAESFVRCPPGCSGFAYGLRIYLTAAPGAGKSWTFTFRVLGADTPLTVTISDAATTGSNILNAIRIFPNQSITLKSVPSGTPAATTMRWSFIFEPLEAGETMVCGNCPANVAAGGVFFAPIGSAAAPSATEFNHEILVPCPGTFHNFICSADAAPGAGETFQYIYRKNSGNTALTCTILDAGRSDSDSTNSFTVAAGDTVSIAFAMSGGAATTRHRYGVTFAPDTPGNFMLPMCSDDTPALDEFVGVTKGDATWQAAEANAQQLANAFTAKALYVELAAAPTQFATYTLWANGGNTILSASVAGGATTANDNREVTIADGDLLSTKYTRGRFVPINRISHVSILGFREPDTLLPASIF